MKTGLCFIFTILALLLVYACSKEEIPEEPDPFEPDDLSGSVVFQEVSTRTLKMADVNSMNNANSYNYAKSYTRPVWSHNGTKFAAIELRSPTETGYEASDFVINIVDVESGSTTTHEIGSSLQIELRGPLSWSPDGKTLAFITQAFSTIIYLDTETGDTIQTEFPEQTYGRITALAWHPNGDLAVSISDSHDYQHDIEIWMLEPFTTTLKTKISAATITRSYAFEFMDWNSTGSKLLLSDPVFYNEFDMLDFNTGEHNTIPNIKGLAPCWSPDGKYILYTGISGVNDWKIIPGLFLTHMEGSFETLLITDAGYSDWH
ncbi:hypothetical protein OU798_10155 [Prolixibacteraceae bacterium Z1-6]|uniref:WD40 repeat domain-containing protein n=1 Tax=Draconibacterium aestuarii TaxID=2998507 RepID=A0A9X3F6F8_9BACT|nr:hypothetical protein [Prolixibacteraceae bacterium Z1-6]